MSITLKTNCKECIHNKLCRHVNNAENLMNELKEKTYGEGPNDDYDWDTMSEHFHVNIEFSCPDFKLDRGVIQSSSSRKIFAC